MVLKRHLDGYWNLSFLVKQLDYFSSPPWGWISLYDFSFPQRMEAHMLLSNPGLAHEILPWMLPHALSFLWNTDNGNAMPREQPTCKAEGAWVCVWSYGEGCPANMNDNLSHSNEWRVSPVLNHWHLVSVCYHCLTCPNSSG